MLVMRILQISVELFFTLADFELFLATVDNYNLILSAVVMINNKPPSNINILSY